MEEARALDELKAICREFISSDGDNDTLVRLVEAADRYWIAEAGDVEPIDLEIQQRRVIEEAVDWDRAFYRNPSPSKDNMT